MNKTVMLKSDFPELSLFKKGKVREIYDLGDTYLMVSSDRLSAFDVIMNQGIPFKGTVLNKISEFWFGMFDGIIENHLVTADVADYPKVCNKYKDLLTGRSMVVKKAELIPLECIVRGYISGSGWLEYQKSGTVCGIKLPDGLEQSAKLPEPLFTPSTKAEIGDHDMNISPEEGKKLVGEDVYSRIEDVAIKIYKTAYDYALERGIIIADTKMEFGIIDGEVILIDELLTPDSSRFWVKEDYRTGISPNSFDKQYVRDYLLSIDFNKQPPAPELPNEVVNNTSEKYLEVYKKLTGKSLTNEA
ncbi:MAG: phosphoribosylaminoimidazole-succinocarboxamide synthase [Melioribacteraceae bacterium]|nr:MAG: phosphoribosylaminoimidazole-succinocarboxamide synthase [Melioribacteraceae bacterium]